MTDVLLATSVSARLLRLFAELTVAFAGIGIGLCVVIVSRYWVVWRQTRDGSRLLPAHVVLIGTSYSMLAVVGVVRLGNPPPVESTSLVLWMVYPWISAAFLIGDVALLLILRFVSRRGARVGPRRRATDPPL